MKTLIALCLLSLTVAAQTVTMTNNYAHCTPGTSMSVPVLGGGWTYSGCTEVYAYKYGQLNTAQQSWYCATSETLSRVIRDKDCTCFTDYSVAPTVTATKSGTICTVTSTEFPADYYCDF